MNARGLLDLGLGLSIVFLVAASASAGPLDWPEADRTCRPWAYNWWLGSAVDKTNLSKELQRYRTGGLGGVHIVPIYGAKGAEDRYIDYLSTQWMEMMSFAVKEGKRLDLGVDMTTGTGWCFGGPNISEELGGRRLVVKRGSLSPDGKLPPELRPDRLTLQALVAYGPDGERLNITDRLKSDGTLNWKPPAKGWAFYVLGHQFSKRMVKRAAPGGAGPMINPFCAAAMRKNLEPFTAAFEMPGIAKPRAMYHDSFEYDSNWSPNLLTDFAKRRAYRLEQELDALAGDGDADRVARLRCDVSETLSDVVIEDVFPQWVEWCHERGIQTRNQAHGAPANWLDFYALADIPETEMFGHGGPDPLVSRFDEHIGGADRNPLISKFASSAAHVSGKSRVSAETGTWLAEHFCETFEELKCEIDLMFLCGVNHIFYHGCVYSPDDAAWPGWLFYASTQMNPRNPLWREAPALNEYVTRCQAVLRDGIPDNDVLLYWPIHDSWTAGVGYMSVHNKAALKGSLGDSARTLWSLGYGFDYVSDRLLGRMHVEGSDIRGPDGSAWKTVVVPVCRQIPHTTLAKLVELADMGATIIFENQLPEDVPGLGRLDARRHAFRETVDRLRFGDEKDGVREASIGKGRVLVGPLDSVLLAAGVRRETMVDNPGIKFIRRKHDEGWYYFVVNHDLKPLDGCVRLATPAKSVVVMDPMTGGEGVVKARRETDDATEVDLRLEPGHSVFLRTFENKQIEGPSWKWIRPDRILTEIRGPWQIEFIAGGPKLPRSFETNELKSWTEQSDLAAKAFAGTARYRCTFDVPAGVQAATRESEVLLDLNEVKHVARVRINGQELGALIMHPYQLTVPPALLRVEGNVLEVEVTNLAANRIRDLDQRKVEWRVFHEINLVNINYRPFDASQWPVFESGLLGPVTLRTAKCVPSM